MGTPTGVASIIAEELSQLRSVLPLVYLHPYWLSAVPP